LSDHKKRLTRAEGEDQAGRPLPFGWRVAGHFLRGAPHFPHKWRVGSALMGRYLKGRGYATTIAFDRGQKITVHLDDWIPFQIFLTGLYETEDAQTRFFRRLVRAGMVVFDVGANVGYYTLQAAVRVGPRGRVHAFEAVDGTYARLRRNIRLNNFANVLAQRCVVRDRAGQAEIFVADAGNTGTSRLSAWPANASGRSEQVRAIALDDYARARGVRQVDVVKIDVEGSELLVLSGMERLLRRGRPRLLVEVSQAAAGKLFDHLGTRGYHPSRITRRGLGAIRPEEIRGKESLVLFQKKS